MERAGMLRGLGILLGGGLDALWGLEFMLGG